MARTSYYLSNPEALTSQYGAMLREVDTPAARCGKCGSNTALLKRGLFVAPAAAGPAFIQRRVLSVCNRCVEELARRRRTVASGLYQ